MRLLLRSNSGLHRLATVDVSNRDGSVNVKFPRRGASSSRETWRLGEAQTPRASVAGGLRSRKITIHATGRVNDDRRRDPIFLEPLTRTSVPSVVAHYRFPSVEGLDRYEGTPEEDDLVWDEFMDYGVGPGCVTLTVAPPSYVPTSPSVRFDYYHRFTLLFTVTDIEAALPSDLSDHFVHLAPGPGPFAQQVIKEDLALVEFHQALTGSQDLVLYGPNGQGWYRAIFAVPMRVAPRATIEAEDPDLVVEVKNQADDPRANTAHVQFRFRHRQSGAVQNQLVSIRLLELDSEV